MPEFEGVIEPMVIGASRGIDNPEEESYDAIPDRIGSFAGRVAVAQAREKGQRREEGGLHPPQQPLRFRGGDASAAGRIWTRWRASSTS